jgi:hypothetical protein
MVMSFGVPLGEKKRAKGEKESAGNSHLAKVGCQRARVGCRRIGFMLPLRQLLSSLPPAEIAFGPFCKAPL